jgi:N-acetylneuraminate synthase
MTNDFNFTNNFIQKYPWPIPRRLYFIAEIGINHNGDINIARRLIEEAKAAGCDAVKFQKRTIDIVYNPEILDQPRKSPWGKTNREQKEGLEFGKDEYDIIDNLCNHLNIDWLASAWDIPSQLFIRQYNLKYNKVASAMITNLDFLEEVASEKKTTFISTGMCTFADIDKAVEIFNESGCSIIIMHTVSTYPAAEDSLNLSLINTLRNRYNLPVGYSGHEASVSPSIMAAMMGAVAIERHITLDRAMYGSDQAASLEPSGLRYLMGALRKIPLCLGNPEKKINDLEVAISKKLRYWQYN